MINFIDFVKFYDDLSEIAVSMGYFTLCFFFVGTS